MVKKIRSIVTSNNDSGFNSMLGIINNFVIDRVGLKVVSNIFVQSAKNGSFWIKLRLLNIREILTHIKLM